MRLNLAGLLKTLFYSLNMADSSVPLVCIQNTVLSVFYMYFKLNV